MYRKRPMNKDFQMWLHYHKYLKEHRLTYNRYLLSRHWQEVSIRFLKSKRGRKVCSACGSTYKINLHHKTYAHIGRERMSELCYLCEFCHLKVHKIYKRKLKYQTLRQVTDDYISAHK